MKAKKTVLLCILDGFGLTEANKGNAISQSKTPNLTYFYQNYPHIALEASGLAVGLPKGQMGNSEVGHLHIGAGRTIYQSLTLIDKSIKEDKTFFSNETIKQALFHAKKNNSKLHIIGLLSDGGVHAHIDHILALLDYCQQENFTNVYVHAILDGRDTKPKVATKHLMKLQNKFNTLGFGVVASLMGRYYAMDRDKRWDRCQKAYDVLVKHDGASFSDPFVYLRQEYKAARSDEFILPAYNVNFQNGNIANNDSIICANFRPDRMIQLASVFTNADYEWNQHQNLKLLKNIHFVTMTYYTDSVKSDGIIFLPKTIINGLGQWVSKQKLWQLRIAETEKYAHVTYFFDGGKDIVYSQTDRILIPSPQVVTYNLQPEMSAYSLTKQLLTIIPQQKYNLIVLNFANPDMVGHTGDLQATIKAIATVDECLGQIYQAIKKIEGVLVVTADHGNAEIMIDEAGDINKKHTSNPVPLIVCDKSISLVSSGTLANVAPTVLDLLEIVKPKEMTISSLVNSSFLKDKK